MHVSLRNRLRDRLVDYVDEYLFRRFATEVSDRFQPPAVRPGEQKDASYRVCKRCVMDSSDPEITFDDEGICHHCRSYDRQIALYVKRDAAGWAEMEQTAATIRKEGEGKPYDCIIGLSGGVDSTYVAYLVVKKLGLRPLAVHMDNGWNTEIAVRNIENVVTRLGIDLHTVVLDWEEFRDLQASFIRAGVTDCEIPTDHAISAVLYKTAIEKGVRFIIGGSNLATEQMVPRTWSSGHGDWRYIRTVHNQFGKVKLKSYPHFTFWEHAIYWPYVREMRMVYILNYIEYNKIEAIKLMKRELGWVSYGDKHHESIYTRFYQTQYLIEKFGADKRRPHLSCLVNDGRITRDEALAELQRPPIAEDIAKTDRDFVLKKLGLTEEEYQSILSAPPKTYWDFDSDEKYFPDKAYHWALHNLELIRHPFRTGLKSVGAMIGGWFSAIGQAIADAGEWLRQKWLFIWMWIGILARLPFHVARRIIKGIIRRLTSRRGA
jgi:N-acetyl sugar amidotransferase